MFLNIALEFLLPTQDSKGQYISKELFDILNFPKKQNEKDFCQDKLLKLFRILSSLKMLFYVPFYFIVA